jgi:hypothetical protein
MVEHHRRRALEKGDQMRYKAIFIAGVAVGFVAGARAGRGAYDKMMDYGQQIAGHPKVQQATSAAQAKATEMAKTAAAKAPDYAKSAANSAKQAATSKMPARFGGTAGPGGATDPAADGKATSAQDDVAPDGNLVYPADGGSPSVKGIRYTPDTP